MEPTRQSGHTVVIGFGRVGSVIGAGLLEGHRPVVVIDDADERVAAARALGIEVVVGNAAAAEPLRLANVAGARAVVVAIPNAFEAGQATEQSRRINPRLRIVARAHSDDEVAYLRRLGADAVILGEREIGLGMLAEVGNNAAPSLEVPAPGVAESLEPRLAPAENILVAVAANDFGDHEPKFVEAPGPALSETVEDVPVTPPVEPVAPILVEPSVSEGLGALSAERDPPPDPEEYDMIDETGAEVESGPQSVAAAPLPGFTSGEEPQSPAAAMALPGIAEEDLPGGGEMALEPPAGGSSFAAREPAAPASDPQGNELPGNSPVEDPLPTVPLEAPVPEVPSQDPQPTEVPLEEPPPETPLPPEVTPVRDLNRP